MDCWAAGFCRTRHTWKSEQKNEHGVNGGVVIDGQTFEEEEKEEVGRLLYINFCFIVLFIFQKKVVARVIF